MELLFSALESVQTSPPIVALRLSTFAYPVVNTAHIIGIALLFGAILPLDLRLLGAWPSIPPAVLARVLIPVAICGLLLAMATGALLFSVGAVRYAGLGVFQLKMLLVLAGTANALLLRRSLVLAESGGLPLRVMGAAGLSIALWLGVITCGRMIAYMD
jgi:hypothetical protein